MANNIVNILHVFGPDEDIDRMVTDCIKTNPQTNEKEFDFNAIAPIDPNLPEDQRKKAVSENWGCGQPQGFSYDPHTRLMTLITPWNPPDQLIKKMAQKYPTLELNMHYYDYSVPLQGEIMSFHSPRNKLFFENKTKDVSHYTMNDYLHDELYFTITRITPEVFQSLTNAKTIHDAANIRPDLVNHFHDLYNKNPEKIATDFNCWQKIFVDFLTENKNDPRFKNNIALINPVTGPYSTPQFLSGISNALTNKYTDKKQIESFLQSVHAPLPVITQYLSEIESNTRTAKTDSPEPKKTKDDYVKATADFFINAIKEGTAPWKKPWKADEYITPFNPVSGSVYSGTNALYLDMYQRAMFKSEDPRWMTFLNIQKNKYHLKKGSHGVPLAYYNKIMVDENGKLTNNPLEAKSYKPVRNYFIVFHASQIEGLPPLEKNDDHELKDRQSISIAQETLDKSGAKILHDSHNNNYYLPAQDEIHLTPKHTFTSLTDYYSTAFHELAHWTSHPSRLNRKISNPVGSPEYAAEELRAEIGSYLISKELRIDFNPQSASSYVASWVKKIQQENRQSELFKACQDAEKIKTFCVAPVLKNQHTQQKSHEPQPARGR
jgi:antirestriction protein ArdC